MAAPWNPPTKNEDFEFAVFLEDYANPGNFKVNPTIAAGDFQITKDGASFANLTNLPTVSPAGGDQVIVVLTATECNSNKWSVRWKDQTNPKEWADGALTVNTTA